MKTVAAFAAISLATLSLNAVAEHELSLPELDLVVAGVFTASALAEANGRGPLVITNTLASSQVSGVIPTLSGSFAQSIALANGPVKVLTGGSSATGSAKGTLSAVTESRTKAFAGYGARTASASSVQTSIATGPGSTASSSSQAVSVIVPY